MAMSEAAKAARRAYKAAYMREYRRKNPEKFRKYEENYWERKAAAMQADAGEDSDDHPSIQCPWGSC